ncbi:MAG: hypothetical protein P8Z69_09330 [Acidihalobacter sp.]
MSPRTKPLTHRTRHLCLALFSSLAGATWAHAATLTVGPGQTYATLGAAARAAHPGDTVKIAPGTYHQCAVWKTNRLTIEGAGPGVVLADKICQGKAIFVIQGNDVTVRRITFRGARSVDGNGAGIRAQGIDLTLENVKFLDNEDGVLAGSRHDSTITVRNSEFVHNGACIKACAHGIYVGHIKLLKIENSRFFDTQVAHHIKSRAFSTILIDNHIEDGPNGTASYEVDIPNGGTLIMTGNVIEKGPRNENPTAAVSIGEEGLTQPTPKILIKDNRFTNDGKPTAFVRNLTKTPAELVGNVIKGNAVTPLLGPGSVR